MSELRGDCITWPGKRDRGGYGRFGRRAAHRAFYEAKYGPIPDGLTVDHLCFNTSCVNPAHMRLLDNLSNARNQRSAHKTHCVNGHEYTPENTYVRPHRSGERFGRDCRACIRARARRAKAKRVTA